MTVSSTFLAADGDGYELQMGRWSRRLAGPFLDFVGTANGRYWPKSDLRAAMKIDAQQRDAAACPRNDLERHEEKHHGHGPRTDVARATH